MSEEAASAPEGSEAVGWRCTHCGHVFRAAPREAHRCPRCLRRSGLLRRDAGSSPPRRRRWLVLGGGTVGTVAAVALGWNMLATDPSAPQEAADPVEVSRSAASLASVPEALRLEPARVTERVRRAADELAEAPAKVVGAVRRARAAGRLPPAEAGEIPAEAPRAADELAVALEGGEAPAAGSLAHALLAGALLEAAGLGPVTYGVDAEVPGGATDPTRRRYRVRVGDGRWRAPDDEAIASSRIRALDEPQLLAQILAWRAYGQLSAEDHEAAAEAAEQARALDPADPGLAFVAGRVRVVRGVTELGLRAMEQAASKRADARTWAQLGRAAVHASRPERAETYLERSLEERAEQPRVHLDLARVLLGEAGGGDGKALRERAARHLERAEALDPKLEGLGRLRELLARLREGSSSRTAPPPDAGGAGP